MRAVVWERGGDERVRNGFKCSVGVSKNKHAGVEHVVGIRTRRQTCNDGREHVEGERGHDKFAVTNLIDDDTADNNAETKTVEARSTDGAQLSAGEAEFRAPIVEDATANREADASGKNGHETSPQKPVAVGDQRSVVNFCHSFVFVLFWLIVPGPIEIIFRRPRSLRRR